MSAALPFVDPDDIPENLLPYIYQFNLPGRTTIRRSHAEDIDVFGWVIDFGNYTFLYSDGSIDVSPRRRAYHELGYVRGEDDLQGKPDSEWRQVQQLQEHYQKLLVMTLSQAWHAVNKAGLPLRYASKGETVRVLWRGADNQVIDTPQAVVIADGRQYDAGRYVRIRYISGPRQGEEATQPLENLLFEDIEHPSA